MILQVFILRMGCDYIQKIVNMNQKYIFYQNNTINSRQMNQRNKYSEVSSKEQFKPKYNYQNYFLQLSKKPSRDPTVNYQKTFKKVEQDKLKKNQKENLKEFNQFLKKSTSQGQLNYQNTINKEQVHRKELQKWGKEMQYRVENLLKVIENCQKEKQMVSQKLEKKLSLKKEEMNRIIGMQREIKKKTEELLQLEIKKHKATREENEKLREEHAKHQQEIKLFEILRTDIYSTLQNFDEVVKSDGILKKELEECDQKNKIEQILKNNHELREKISIIFKASFEREKKQCFKEMDNLKAMNKKLTTELEKEQNELTEKNKLVQMKEVQLKIIKTKINSINKLSFQIDQKINQFTEKQSQQFEKLINIKSSLVKTCLQETQQQQQLSSNNRQLKNMDTQTQINYNFQYESKKLESVTKQMGKKQEEVDVLKKENKELKQQLLVLHNQLHSLQNNKINYDEEKNNFKNQEINLKMQIFNLELQVTQCKKQVDLNKNKSKQRIQMQNKIQKLQKEIMSLRQSKGQLEELNLKTQQYSSNIVEMEKQLAGKKRQMEESQKFIEKMRKQSEKKQKSINILNSQLNQLEIQIQSKNQQIKLQQMEIINLKSKFKEGNNQREKLFLKTIQEKEESLEEVIGEKKSLENMVLLLQEKNSHLKNEMENKYQKQISYLKKILQNTNMENDKLKIENQKFRKDLSLSSKFEKVQDIQLNISEFNSNEQKQQNNSNINYQ